MTSSVFSGGAGAPGAAAAPSGASAAAAVAAAAAANPPAPLHAAGPAPEAAFPCTPLPGGGVASARGFSAAGVHAGFRKEPGRLDLAVVAADEPCACAAVFTRNAFCAAPVRVSRMHLSEGGATPEGGPAWGTARGVVVNSGNANAGHWRAGPRGARATARMAARALGCEEREVVVASTGVIGQHLPLAPFEEGLPAAVAALSKEGGASAARAIMTTDTRPKEAACTFSVEDAAYAGCTFTVGGMAKGSGMIMPDMATMIAVLATDAPVSAPDAHAALSAAVARTFNKVTVDSDTSTNDSCFLFANGAAAPGLPAFSRGGAAFRAFAEALEHVCTRLARAMAADGEGASRLVTVRVTGAATPADADAAARAVANSPLVKTAVNGHDANWGASWRPWASRGRPSGRRTWPWTSWVFRVPRRVRGSLRRRRGAFPLRAPRGGHRRPLGGRDAQATVWTCDLTHEYITINGDYRT